MLEDLDQGDVAETVKIFFDASKKLAPVKKSDLSIQDVSRTIDNYNIWGIKYKLQIHQYLLDKMEQTYRIYPKYSDYSDGLK